MLWYHPAILVLLAVCFYFKTVAADCDQQAVPAEPVKNGASDYDHTARESVQPTSSGETLDIRCVDGVTTGPTGEHVTLNGEPFKCPGEGQSLRRILRAGIGAKIGYKLYSFSNVGTREELDYQLKKLGRSESWINKYAPAIYKTLKSHRAKRIFGAFTVVEGGFAVYEFYQDAGYIYGPDRVDREFKTYGEAERYLKQEVQRAQKRGPDEYAKSLYNLAEFYYKYSKYSHAELAYKHVLTIWGESPPQDLRYVGTARGHYADVLRKLGHSK